MSEVRSISPVRDVALILDDGTRIEVDVRPTGEMDGDSHCWSVVMEVDANLVMPRVVKIDGVIPKGHCLSVPCGPGYDSAEWGRRIFANSPCLNAYHEGGHDADGWVTR